MTPALALAALRDALPTRRYSTRLAETPVWFVVDSALPFLSGMQTASVVELPSRHAQTVTCWDATNLAPVGSGSRLEVAGNLYPVKAGFAIHITPSERLLCRGTFMGPAYIEAIAWRAADLQRSARQFHDNAAIIAGGLTTLAVFVFLTALINREWTYVIFAAWLIGNMRICANAMGWDSQWFGYPIPPGILPVLRELTFAAYYLITIELFQRLFRDQLRSVGHVAALKLVRCASVPLLVCAMVLPYRYFIPALWTLSAIAICVLIFLLGLIIWRSRTRTVLWYAASMTTVLGSILSEVCSAAFGVKLPLGDADPVVTVLMSSLMAAVAIAEKIRAERDENRRAQIRLRDTYDVTPVGLFTLDGNGQFLQTNAALRDMLKMREGSYRHRYWQDYFQPGCLPQCDAQATTGRPVEKEIHPHTFLSIRDRCFLLKIIRSNGCLEGSLQDITERSKAVERLRFLADHDSLSGLLNRRGLQQAIHAMSRQSAPWALAYIDLDRFKLINDLFGHQAGDQVLRQVAARLRTHFGADTRLARIGGDEFVCVVSDLSVDSVLERCTELYTLLNDTPYRSGNRVLQVKASLGVVECTRVTRAQDALSHAACACREAKKHPHSRMMVYRAGAPIFERYNREMRLVEMLRQNRLPSGLFLMMQPIMSLAQPGDSLNFEVLLRRRAPDGTVELAGEIIVAAEESGHIAAIDRWVLTSVLDWIEINRKALGNTRFICVNLSGGSLNDEQFVEYVCALLKRHRACATMLCLEITETIALHDLANTQKFISRVHELGAKIAFDDFGAGYTSFRYLKDMSADALKIDGEFIRSMPGNPANVAIVEAIVSLARNLGMRSIAESVEDVETLQILREINVDYVQGFIIAKPQLAKDILEAHAAVDFISDRQLLEELHRDPGSDSFDALDCHA
ncbi:EAL domain-containing protein (plasmid) [Paraburkholderia sp. PREW-6R]|uniref:EAL domain-containing protein n=1 Tax=Paraburkholderia sp. PREW-6R TaxID=3141544 RepID=UPI0031F53F22